MYNILDKLASLVYYYFNLEEHNIYFRDLLNEKIRDFIIDGRNFQFLALYSLANDFASGNRFENLRDTRNSITHNYLEIYKTNDQDILNYNSLFDKTLELFEIVKSGIIYYLIAVRIENMKHKNNIDKSFEIGVQK